MKARSSTLAMLTPFTLPALAHDLSAHRHTQPALASCVPFEGKKVEDIDQKDPKIKVEYDKCEDDKRLQKEAADAAEHDDY